jgi:hypothetical protein
MYTIDNQDTVVELTDVPQSSTGAPCPLVLSGDTFVHLAYLLHEPIKDWDGQPRSVGENSPNELCALVRFKLASAHMFGPPGDETFHGHPLAKRGLKHYSVSEVKDSSWIRSLERMNSVHPRHRPERFFSKRHFIFAFHDSVFECVAEGFELTVHRGSVASVLRASWPEE